MIKAASLAIFLILAAMNALPQPAGDPDSELLAWNEFYDLQWFDFQGTPGHEARGDAGTAVKIKATPFLVKGKVRYDVVALFDRQRSWVLDQSPSLLAHERLHFDIAELYARKIRKKIIELRNQGVNNVGTYNAEIRKLLEESNRVDIQYDLETLHGALAKKQEIWSTKVRDDLKGLEHYKKAKHIIAG